jgi:hypothetical protein
VDAVGVPSVNRSISTGALRSARSRAQRLPSQKSLQIKIFFPRRCIQSRFCLMRAAPLVTGRATPPVEIETLVLAARKVRRGLIENLNWTRVCPNLPRTAQRRKIVSSKRVQLRLGIN